MIFVTSWDDGHPLDERIAELLNKHSLRGTFFVPITNCEGRPVMQPSTMRRLSVHFEIGSHTLNHVRLPGLVAQEQYRQVAAGKDALEQMLGHQVAGFCYPGGKVNGEVHRIVKQAGFSYGRTTENFRLDCGTDAFAIPTTMQFYPHSQKVLLRNFISKRNYLKRAWAFRSTIFGKDWIDGLSRLAEKCVISSMVFHLWGHSWEIQERDLWPALDAFFRNISSLRPTSRTVGELLNEHDLRAGLQ